MFKVLRRFQSTASKIIQQCPPPTRNTGCTYCLTNDMLKDLPEIYQPPHNVANTVPPMEKIIVYLSGDNKFEEWPKKMETEVGSIMNILGGVRRGKGIGILYSSLKSDEKVGGEQFLVYPQGVKVNLKDSSENTLHDFFNKVCENKLNELEHEPVNDPVVLICSHAQRDIRCGVVGPLVANEFEAVVKSNVQVGLVSHVSGHVYAGNVLIGKPGGVAWYGMVRPENVQGLVKVAVEGNDIIKELYRGKT